MKRKYLLIAVVTILIVLLTTEIGILTSYVSNLIDPSFKPFALPCLGIIVLVVAALTVQLYFLQRNTEHPALPSSNQNRQRMLTKVHSFWIKGVLEQSLHNAALIILGLHEQRDALANPWQYVIQQPDESEHSMAPGICITDVYDDAGGELLILGEPGSGKTTLLLELARNLLDRAELDNTLQMPVIFNLSSWATKQQPLTEWLIEELNTKYQVPRKLAQTWMNTDQILPLLDGLDEVNSSSRTACVNTINTYRQEHMVSTVVCSRRTEYLAQKKRVALRNAVVVQPLTAQQIDDYLSSAGGQLAAIRVALREDKVLRELATTPLMLSILRLVYQEKSVEDLLMAGSPETQRHQVFEKYVEQMLHRRSGKTRYTVQQTKHQLAWLAQQMKQHSQTEFYIEWMQPDWLSSSQLYQIYESLAMRLPDMIIGGIVSLLVINMLSSTVFSLPFELRYGIYGGLIGGLISREKRLRLSAESNIQSLRNFLHGIFQVRYLRNGLIVGLIFGLSYGLSYGLWIGICYGLGFGLVSELLSVVLEGSRLKRPSAKATIWSWRSLWRSLNSFGYLGMGLSAGLSYGLGYVLSTELTHRLQTSQSDVLAYALLYVLNYTLIGILLSVILEGRKLEIQPAEIIVWSWRSLWRSLINSKHLRNGLLIGLLVGVIIGMSAALKVSPIFGLRFGLNAGLTFGLSYWLLLGLFKGLSSSMLEEQQRVKPNLGMWRSARNSIFIGLISGLVSWFICTMSYMVSFWFISGPGSALSIGWLVWKSIGLFVGLSVGVLCGLLNGGLACVQHSILRLLLWWTGVIPWNYPGFLDYAAECILLRKVGGGYIFIHRLLLEYFLSPGGSPTLRKEARQEQDEP